jgi:hypothetical protein
MNIEEITNATLLKIVTTVGGILGIGIMSAAGYAFKAYADDNYVTTQEQVVGELHAIDDDIRMIDNRLFEIDQDEAFNKDPDRAGKYMLLRNHYNTQKDALLLQRSDTAKRLGED